MNTTLKQYLEYLHQQKNCPAGYVWCDRRQECVPEEEGGPNSFIMFKKRRALMHEPPPEFDGEPKEG
jgi:hypothetical protein